MNRIFLSLAVVSLLLLMIAMGFGLGIEDPASREAAEQAVVQRHLMFAFGGLVVALMVHGLVLTYFMGTGRWIEETSMTYLLDDKWRRENHSLKYRTLPLMVGSVFLLIAAGAFGAAADPASAVGFTGWFGLSAATWHFLVAMLALGVHLIATFMEYFALSRNGELIQEVMREVHRIRYEHGLMEPPNPPPWAKRRVLPDNQGGNDDGVKEYLVRVLSPPLGEVKERGSGRVGEASEARRFSIWQTNRPLRAKSPTPWKGISTIGGRAPHSRKSEAETSRRQPRPPAARQAPPGRYRVRPPQRGGKIHY